ncbi:MAG: hypothetical protein ACK5MN_11885 [Lachnospiraceae bacterium]
MALFSRTINDPEIMDEILLFGNLQHPKGSNFEVLYELLLENEIADLDDINYLRQASWTSIRVDALGSLIEFC